MGQRSLEGTTTNPDGVSEIAGEQSISLRGVSKKFANGTTALEPVDLDISPGEFVTIVGPSGCGKSTLLRIVAGLTDASSGECTTLNRKNRAFVFQDATLLPWRTVQRNGELLLELEGVPRPERSKRAAESLALVGLEDFAGVYPRNLSGGMKMRLSLARAVALRPKLFLLDEPFSALDEITREGLNDQLLRLRASEGFTSIFITHNLYEAVYMSTRVVVMSARPGRIVADIRVPFPYPRTPELRATAEFAEFAGLVSRALKGLK